MKNKIAFIVPYFGKFNNYFSLWLKSCEKNPDIDWIIFTDDFTVYHYPPNVIVHYTTFSETIKLFQSNYDFTINLNTPYQLCEYKVAYGEVYSQYLINYNFWGFCDVDVIWGNISSFITDEILDKFHKISWRGHFSVFKNEYKINRIYRSVYENHELYKIVFSDQTGIPFAFDELWLNLQFESLGYLVYKKLPFADLKIRNKNFELLHFAQQDSYKNEHQIFIWANGNLYRLFVKDNEIFREEFCYIHFLKRPMEVMFNVNLQSSFAIIPNKFVVLDRKITAQQIMMQTKKGIYMSYILERLTIKYFRNKRNYYSQKQLFNFMYRDIPSMFYEVIIPRLTNTVKIGSFYSLEN